MKEKIILNTYLLLRWTSGSGGDRYRVVQTIRADCIEPARRMAEELTAKAKPGETVIIAQELEEILL